MFIGSVLELEILKGGFWGEQRGDGALISHGHTIGYYKTGAASYGLQAGIQKFGYALFFMNNGDLAYLRKSRGWEIGSGPSLVIVDRGIAKSLTATTLRKGVHAFAFWAEGFDGWRRFAGIQDRRSSSGLNLTSRMGLSGGGRSEA
jgi:lipid-binding SYLF domain-containing protein